jgi:hypothetical protein
MVHHVYDPMYCKVLTIVVCDMQFEGIKVQWLMWKKLNETMLKHWIPNSISRDSWLITHKPIGMQSELFMVQRTPLSRWLIRSAHVYSIGLNHLINTPNNLLDLNYKMSIKLFSTNTRMPHPLGTLIVIML